MAERKILIVTNRVPFPLKDGGNLAMRAMIEGYYNAGWQVYLLAMNTVRHHVSEEQLTGLYQNIHAFQWVNVDNSVKRISIIKNFLFSKLPEHATRFYKPEFEQKIVEVLNDFNPDFVQIESVYLSTYLPAIRKHSNAITVLRLHNLEYQIWHSLSVKKGNTFKKFYLADLSERLKAFEREAWKKYDLLLPITQKDANHVTMLEHVTNMIVAPFGIDINNVPVRHVQERWVGYHIGAMDWLANSDAIRWFLNDIWPRIHKEIPEFEFYFAGRNMPDEFRQENAKGVYCMDEVPDANEFIADKKILIVPLRSAGGIRVKILEALAAKKIVIATNTAIKGIEAKPGVHFILAKQPGDFVKGIRWCLDNKEEAERMAERGKKLVTDKYNQATVIDNIINELEKLYAP